MNRLHNWLTERRKEFSDSEIIAGVGNGDIESPGHWMGISEGSDYIKIWDTETIADNKMGFIYVSYQHE